MSDLRIDLSDFGPAGEVEDGEGWIWRTLFLLPLLATLPFLLLLRGGVHATSVWGWSPWSAVAGGVCFAALALALLTWLSLLALGMPGGVRRWLTRGAILLVVAYAGYGLVYVAARHAKSASVRAEYRNLHPILRLASTSLFLVDAEAVVTDASRDPGDYRAMGLSPVESSLHFPQEDGYVHALDLRTVGRSEWRNWLGRAAFRVMGFRTLRHAGTADHLHISLPPAQ